MLHILWLALKFIGILLMVALALLLLAAVLILFCPLAYRVRIKKDVDWQVWGRVYWLFGLVSVTVQKESSGFQKVFRICGVRTASWKNLFVRKKRSKKIKKAAAEKSFREEEFRKAEDGAMPEENAQKENVQRAKSSAAPEKKSQEEEGIPAPAETVQKAPPVQDEKRQPKRKNFIYRLWTRIAEKCRGIRDAFFRFVDTVRNICGRVAVWRVFLGDARTKAAFGLTWQQLLRLLRHAGPQKWKGYVNLGFENPAVTGQALAALGAAYPIHRGRISVNPVWDRAVLEGEVFVKGRVFGILLLHIAGILYFDKDMKYAVNWFRQQES